ncbi:MAG: hypothetical protein PHC61_03765 [Chitinivibrionales bacterium]|nr:hypothetical protein [Chitinivibrionales bacterium]
MAYLGIGFSGKDPSFLHAQVEKYSDWLKGDRQPHFFGDCFVVLYDSNTAREFVKKCSSETDEDSITVYSMSRPIEYA